MVGNILINEIVVKVLNERIINAKSVLKASILIEENAKSVSKEQVNRCEELGIQVNAFHVIRADILQKMDKKLVLNAVMDIIVL